METLCDRTAIVMSSLRNRCEIAAQLLYNRRANAEEESSLKNCSDRRCSLKLIRNSSISVTEFEV
jgi:hypothetical protein